MIALYFLRIIGFTCALVLMGTGAAIAQDNEVSRSKATTDREAGREKSSNEPQDDETEDKRPLYEREPFDVVYLDEINQNAELIVGLLDFPARQLPDPLPASGVLEVRFVDQPGEVFEVEWQHIKAIDLFESLILKEANDFTRKAKQLADAKKYVEAGKHFDDAYWYFEYLIKHDPETPRLDLSVDNYLMQNAVASFASGNHADALSILSELERRTPNRKGLGSSQRRVTDALFKEYVREQKYWKARELLEQWAESTDPRWVQMVDGRRSQLTQLAAQYLEKAQLLLATKEFRNAVLATQRALDIDPNVSGGQALRQQLVQQYSVVTVGVRQPFVEGSRPTLANWSANRCSRLLRRDLVEFHGSSSEGGEYFCPWGTLKQSDDGTTLHLELRPVRSGEVDVVGLSSYDVAQYLLNMADPASSHYRMTWSVILDSLSVKDIFKLDMRLRHTFVKPEALLQFKRGTTNDESSGTLLGPYRFSSNSNGETRFLSQSDFSLSVAAQPRQIVERQVDGRQIGRMLRLGEIDVLDRVNPVYVSQLESQADIVLARYEVPTIHVLVPNREGHPLLSDPLFRKALVYGLNRELLLNQMILGGADPLRGQVLSGPFPAGFSPNDPLGYAYHIETDPLPYHVAMGRILYGVAMDKLARKAEENGEEVPARKPLILAYPHSDVARIASQVMVEQLKLLEIPVELKALPPGVVQPEDAYDLLYMEWTVNDPVVDAGRIFGTGGLVRGSSAYLRHTVRQLNQVTNWLEAREILNKIHQIVYQEVTVIPLWQLAEYMAYHQRLQGIGSAPAHLYQNVEQWRIVPRVVGDET